MQISYGLEPDLSVEEFREVLCNCMPDDTESVVAPERLEQMLRRADLVVTARDQGRLVGVSRALTDFVYCCYLADLAVDAAYQRQGIGKLLVEQTRRYAGEETTLIVVAFPAADGFYARIGLEPMPGCWSIPRSR
jgi:GNAT superfamily N-acetyltransferase